MPHFHLSLQAGDDMILKRMKRRHGRADAIRFCEDVRKLRPDVVFGADIIAGFPTEDDAMFDNTLRIVEEADLTYLHVFPYSPREGTPAARMPQVDKGVARRRAAMLRAAGERQIAILQASRIGLVENVLVERDGVGRTEQFLPVAVAGVHPGELLAVRVTGSGKDGLIGEALRNAA